MSMAETNAAGPTRRTLFLFRVGSSWFAAPPECVAAVSAVPDRRTRVPTAPEHVLGVVNHRGRAVALFDLARFLGLEAPPRVTRQLVLRADEFEAAVLVEQARGMIEVNAESLRPSDGSMPYVTAITDQEFGVVQLLDVAGLMSAAAA